MKKLSIFFSLLILSCSLFATPPTNLAIDKKEIENYVSSGEYITEIKTVVDEAKIALQKAIEENHQRENPEKLAIVLDIDETSLSNYNDMKSLDFGGSLSDIYAKQNLSQDTAIAPTLALYNYAKANNVAVFFVTGRPVSQKAITEKNLTAVGYKDWDGIYFKPDDYQDKSAIPYKSHTRQLITQKGYHIVLSLGDQPSDLMGGFAEETFLLPNPFYSIP
jgi:predicted secreted acid phosphatase